MKMILKVQRPLASSEPDAPYLVYAMGRRFTTHVPPAEIPASVKTAMGADAKGYFMARLEVLGIGETAPAQSKVHRKRRYRSRHLVDKAQLRLGALHLARARPLQRLCLVLSRRLQSRALRAAQT